MLLLTAVAACDSVPDAVNPLAEKKAAQPGETLDTSAVPGAEKPYPNLADVPDRPSYRLTKEQRESLIEGLVADREHARHTGAPTLQSSAEPAQGMLMSTQPRGKVEEIGAAGGTESAGNKLATIGFAAGSTALPPEAIDILAGVAEVQKERQAKVRIVGHAAAEGGGTSPSGAGPMEVSAERARVVAEELVRLGVARTDIVIRAMGDRAPIAEDAPDVSVGADRAEIFLEV